MTMSVDQTWISNTCRLIIFYLISDLTVKMFTMDLQIHIHIEVLDLAALFHPNKTQCLLYR